ncbi:hypothetical protein GCM10017691_03390 [Pseudonocardia petroleophila]
MERPKIRKRDTAVTAAGRVGGRGGWAWFPRGTGVRHPGRSDGAATGTDGTRGGRAGRAQDGRDTRNPPPRPWAFRERVCGR